MKIQYNLCLYSSTNDEPSYPKSTRPEMDKPSRFRKEFCSILNLQGCKKKE